MKRYYIPDKTQPKGFREISEAEAMERREHHAEVNSYAERVEHEEITIADVPHTHKADVEKKLTLTMREKAEAYDMLVASGDIHHPTTIKKLREMKKKPHDEQK